MTITEIRQVVSVAGRALHMRRLGQGRPIVLLHESPRSSAALLPLAMRLAPHFTVFALDTPGYGYSDPLRLQRPEIVDFADAIAESLRALGLRRIPVYGTHTGATIAAEMGRRHPDLVSGLVLDGYPVFTVAERDLHHGFYLPQFPPRWNGSHVVALWTRIRDQFDFFPWYTLSEATRLRTPKASLERHRAVLRDFLAAGEHYSTAYAASFRFEALSVLRDLRVPTHVMARETDLLFSHLERLGPLPEVCQVGSLPADLDAWAAAIKMRIDPMAGDAAPPSPCDLLDPSPIGQKGVFDGRLLCRFYGTPGRHEKTPVILLHDTPGGALEWNDLAMRFAADRLVIVPELPNHGRSSDVTSDADGFDALDKLFGALLARLGPKVALVGRGLGARLSETLAQTHGPLVDRIVLVSSAEVEGTRQAEPAEPWLPERWDGADLLAEWFAVRDDTLYGSTRDARQGPAPMTQIGFDVGAIHERFRSRVMANGQDRLYEAALRRAMTLRTQPSMPIVRFELSDREAIVRERSYADHAPLTLGNRIAAALDA